MWIFVIFWPIHLFIWEILILNHIHIVVLLLAQSCGTLCDPMDYSPPDSSVHGISQARVLEWVATSFTRGSSRPRDQIRVSLIGGRHFNLWATREALKLVSGSEFWLQSPDSDPDIPLCDWKLLTAHCQFLFSLETSSYEHYSFSYRKTTHELLALKGM